MTDLQEILDTMDIPELRKKDLHWLWRNIRIRNSGHPMIEEAVKEIKGLLRKTCDVCVYKEEKK